MDVDLLCNHPISGSHSPVSVHLTRTRALADGDSLMVEVGALLHPSRVMSDADREAAVECALTLVERVLDLAQPRG